MEWKCSSEAQVRAALVHTQAGQPVPVVLRRLADGQTQTRTVIVQTFPDSARTVYFVLPYMVGLLFLGISLWIFGMRRTELAGRAFALFATSVAIACAGLFDLYTTHRLSLLWTLSLACAGGALIDMALVFPQEARWVKDRPYLRWIGYAARPGAVHPGSLQLIQLPGPDCLHLQLAVYLYPGRPVGPLFCRHVALPAHCRQISGGAPAGRRHPGGDADRLWTAGRLVPGDGRAACAGPGLAALADGPVLVQFLALFAAPDGPFPTDDGVQHPALPLAAHGPVLPPGRTVCHC